MPTKLTIRLSPEEHRKFKMAATERGVTLQEAFEQMLADWLHRPEQSMEPDIFSFQGSMADTDVLEDLEREHREEIARDA